MTDISNEYELLVLLQDSYHSPFDLENFRLYCERRCCVENISFLLAVFDLYKEVRQFKYKETLKPKIDHIFKTFVQRGARFELNISSDALQNCAKKVENYDSLSCEELIAVNVVELQIDSLRRHRDRNSLSCKIIR
eukprot:Pgem_evm1s12731